MFKTIRSILFPLLIFGSVILTMFTAERDPALGTTMVKGVFVFISVYIILESVLVAVWKHMTCTEEVTATCVDVLSRRRRKGGRTYCPVWEYYYNGNMIQMQEDSYSNVSVPKVGDEGILYVNPQKPEKFRRKGNYGFVFTIAAGLIFLMMSLYMFSTMK